MTGEVSFGWESAEAVAADPRFRDLIERQWRELSFLPDPPQPDYRRAFEMERAGSYRLWVGRESGEMVGFIQWQVVPPLGYRDTLWAFDCGHWLEPVENAIWTWVSMWRSAEAALRKRGVRVMRGHDNTKRPMAVAFKRLGFTPVATSYQKVL